MEIIVKKFLMKAKEILYEYLHNCKDNILILITILVLIWLKYQIHNLKFIIRTRKMAIEILTVLLITGINKFKTRKWIINTT